MAALPILAVAPLEAETDPALGFGAVEPRDMASPLRTTGPERSAAGLAAVIARVRSTELLEAPPEPRRRPTADGLAPAE